MPRAIDPRAGAPFVCRINIAVRAEFVKGSWIIHATVTNHSNATNHSSPGPSAPGLTPLTRVPGFDVLPAPKPDTGPLRAVRREPIRFGEAIPRALLEQNQYA